MAKKSDDYNKAVNDWKKDRIVYCPQGNVWMKIASVYYQLADVNWKSLKRPIKTGAFYDKETNDCNKKANNGKQKADRREKETSP